MAWSSGGGKTPRYPTAQNRQVPLDRALALYHAVELSSSIHDEESDIRPLT